MENFEFCLSNFGKLYGSKSQHSKFLEENTNVICIDGNLIGLNIYKEKNNRGIYNRQRKIFSPIVETSIIFFFINTNVVS